MLGMMKSPALPHARVCQAGPTPSDPTRDVGPLRRRAEAGIAGSALVLILASGAQAQPSRELADLVRQQAAEIAALRSRLDALEAEGTHTGAPPIAPAPATPTSTPDGPRETAGIEADWSDGAPALTSADGRHSFRLRGRVLLDAATTTGSDFADRNLTTTGARAVRLGVEGGLGENFIYQLEVDFAEGDEAELKGAYIGWRGGLGDNHDFDVRLGSILNDRSLESSTGNDTTPFIERNAVATGFSPTHGLFGIGAMARLFGPGYHLSLQMVGDDTTGSTAGTDVNDTFTVIGRSHWNPVSSETSALHLGLWGYAESLPETRPAYVRNTNIAGPQNGRIHVALGPLPSLDGSRAYGVELGGVHGPVWAFAEAGRRTLSVRNRFGGGEVETSAWSISGGWLVTGEQAPYSARTGNFNFVSVRRPVDDGGAGALELLARYEHLDYSDAPLGGEGWSVTLGANWYLTDISRLMLNVVRWETDNLAGDFIGRDQGIAVNSRFQVSF